ncbi:hypothetical protein CSB11_00960 [Candidatus Campbellbacteria bacterium]|nr:MAG: hypothetical protein CSB11_00960 [Candidatus Campbellbacteria bacterium]
MGNKFSGKFGVVKSFTTQYPVSNPTTPESVTTNPATNIEQTCAVLNGYLNLNDSSSSVVGFDYGSSYSSLSKNVSSGIKYSSTNFAKKVCGLEPGRTYYFRAKTSTGKFGSVKSFKTVRMVNQVEPTVTTKPATNIEQTCAVLNGYVELNDSSSEYVKFNYGTSYSSLNKTINIGTKYSSTNFSKQICNLQPGKTYYFKALTNSGVVGSVKSFKTQRGNNQVDTSVTTNEASEVTQTCANLNGYIELNDTPSEYVGFKWGTSVSSLSKVANVGTQYSSTDFSKRICNLQPGKTYYFRAGTSTKKYGVVKSFTTQRGNNQVDTSVTTNEATEITQTCANLNGYVELNDTPSEFVGFKWGTDLQNLKKVINVGTKYSSTDFSSKLCNLTPGRTYYFRAGTSSGKFGDVKSFITQRINNEIDSFVETNEASDISQTCANLNGYVELNDTPSEFVGFKWGTDLQNLKKVVNIGTKYSSTTFSKKLCNLTPGKKYYFRAGTSSGKSGDVKSFRTKRGNDENGVEISTKKASNITERCATLKGYVELNDEPNEFVKFRYGEDETDLDRKKNYGEKENSGYFSKNVCDLKPNTKYYFQAYSENDMGDILHFRTKKGSIILPPSDKTGVITKGHYAGVHAADLYGKIIGGDERVICYFEYGTDDNLANTSEARIKNVYQSRDCYNKVRGLVPNTRYYYRAVAVDDGEKYTGQTKSFVTKVGGAKPPRPTTGIVINENVTITVEEIVEGGNDLEINKWVSLEDQRRGYGLETNAGIGQTVYYKVRVKNNTRDDIQDVTVTDHIPYELELSDKRDIDDRTEKYLTWKIGKMKSGEVREFVTEMTVSDRAIVGENITSRAEIVKDGKVEHTNYVDIYVTDKYGGQGANISGSGGGFTILKVFLYLGLLLLILIIGLLISRVLATRR